MRYLLWLVAGIALCGCAHSPTTVLRFNETAQMAGLDYRWTIEGKRPLTILQTIGNGCAFLDFNQDGNLDILLVGKELALFQGDGRGKFVRSKNLPPLEGHFLGCAVGDINNDGYPDLCLTGFQEGRILRNYHGQTFSDVTAQWQFEKQHWGASAAFGDLDNDGFLDLYTTGYVRFRPGTNLDLCPVHNTEGKTIQASCPPTIYPPSQGILYRNETGTYFTNITATWGANQHTGNGLGVAFADYDGSGWSSFAIANDMMESNLFQNAGGTMLENVGPTSGIAYNGDGKAYAGMGLDWGDYDNDGKLDLLMTAFENQSKPLYHNEGGGIFTDRSASAGLAIPLMPDMPFGCKFADFDNDGNLDIVYANGHVQDQIAEVNPQQSYKQRVRLFQGNGTGQFMDAGKASRIASLPSIVGRGLATGDYDNDGRIDLLIVDSEGVPLLLHNETPVNHYWLGLRLKGTRSNRDGYGAQVTVEVGSKKIVRHCHADGSFLSSSDHRVHFGLGENNKVEAVTIRWPNGLTETFPIPGIDCYITLTEGTGK
jgi:enediyne biosynthesis protein E4